MVFITLSHGAWLEWDFNPASEGVIGYYGYAGTNSRNYTLRIDVGDTNLWRFSRLTIPRAATNYFAVTASNSEGESDFSEEVFYVWPNTINAPFTNVTLRILAGKFYVEHGDTPSPSAWLVKNVVTGPTNISFPTVGTMGFFRYRPYFVSFANPKGGSAKLMAAKKPMLTAEVKPVPISTPHPTPVIGPVNLDPSKR